MAGPHLTTAGKRRLLSALVAAGLVGVLVAAIGWKRGTESAAAPTRRSGPTVNEVQIAPVERGRVLATLELTGNLLPRKRTLVVAEVDGVIQSIPRSKQKIEVEVEGRKYSEYLGLDIGQAVAKGEVLAQIDPTEYELELAAAQARLDKAEKDLEQLRAGHRPEEVRRRGAAKEDARARLERTRSEFKRVAGLRERGAISQSELETSQAELRQAQAAVERAEADLAESAAGPTETETAVAQALIAQARADVRIHANRLRKTTIRAPFDAIIVDRFVDEGQRVTAQPRVEIMELMDLSLVVAQVGVPERYMHQVKIGDLAQVKANGATDPVPGLVVLVNSKVDHETRTFRVRVAVENHERRFKAGQFAKAAFNIASSPETLFVPSRALVYSGGEPRVFVYQDDRVSLRPVKIGLSGNGKVEIVQGVQAGDRVVVDNPSILADGMAVRVAAHGPDGRPAARRASRTEGKIGR